MASSSNLNGTDLHIDGHFSSKTMSVPNGTITDAMVNGSAAFQYTKLQQCHRIPCGKVAPATAITAFSENVYTVRGATGTLVQFAAWFNTVATGADRTVTVDLHKSTGAGAFATVLSATIGFTNVSTANTVSSGTFSATGLVVGDLLKVVVTVAGAAGNQAIGLLVEIMLAEDPA